MLKINNLNVSLTDRNILENINISFQKGSVCCIIGKNGGGKSTLLKAIECLVPSSGNILYDETDIKNMEIKDRAKLISYLPQSRPIPSISARLMVEHGRFPHLGFSKTLRKNDKDIVNEAIELTGIKSLLNKNLTCMSGGEVQRVYIASTLAQQSEIILLDEPTTHLDLESQIEILSLIKSLKNENRTIIVVLHDLLQAFTFFDRIYILDDKNFIEEGTPEELIKSNNIKKVFNYNIEKDSSNNSLYKYKIVK